MTVERTTWWGARGKRKASLLIASVVFFPKMTVAVCGSAPTRRAIVECALSYAAVLRRDLKPVPRCTLE